MLKSALAFRRITFVSPSLMRKFSSSHKLNLFSPGNSHNKFNHQHPVFNVDNRIDPRLRNYLMKTKASFELSIAESEKNYTDGDEFYRFQSLTLLASKLLEAENELLELQSISSNSIDLTNFL